MKNINTFLKPCLVNEHPNNTSENVLKYLMSKFENTYFLGYRDIPLLLEKYAKGKKTLDYGCGTGRSTRFLKNLKFDVIGADISKEMLSHAHAADDSIHYLHIKSGEIPLLNNSCDLIFSCFVLFTVSSRKELLTIFNEIYRCLRVGGVFAIVTGSEDLYKHPWLSYNIDYPQNQNLKSGDIAKIQLKDLGVEFINYFWTDADYQELFCKSGFTLVEKHFPLGIPKEKNWISETHYSPYVIYILKK